MTDVLEPASMIGAAQEAVAAGDFPEAERLLREAAHIQEATLGSKHPDLASTLNNLAFVCERLNKLAEAERGYRRAHAIAVASLGPRHPFVATSVKNLVEFCAAHDIPIWTPPASRSNEEPISPDATDALEPEAATSAVASTDPATGIDTTTDFAHAPESASAWMAPRTLAFAVVAVAVFIVVFAMRPRQATPTETISPPPSSPPLTATSDAPPPTAVNPTPIPTSVEPLGRVTPSTTTPQSVSVLNAQLCTALDKNGSPDWQCTAAAGELHPGTYTFYTRILTTDATTVEHRWYRDDRVHQVMRLRVSANPNSGYRTFSSNTISPERAGQWKVELRTADGTLLREERFVVR